MACVVIQQVKVEQILPVYGTYLKLYEDIITIDPIADAKSNYKMTHDNLTVLMSAGSAIHSSLTMPWCMMFF